MPKKQSSNTKAKTRYIFKLGKAQNRKHGVRRNDETLKGTGSGETKENHTGGKTDGLTKT